MASVNMLPEETGVDCHSSQHRPCPSLQLSPGQTHSLTSWGSMTHMNKMPTACPALIPHPASCGVLFLGLSVFKHHGNQLFMIKTEVLKNLSAFQWGPPALKEKGSGLGPGCLPGPPGWEGSRLE